MRGEPISLKLAEFAVEYGIVPRIESGTSTINSLDTCSYCGYGLFKDTENTNVYFTYPFFLCGKCKQLSDFSSYYEYEKLPVMYKDVAKGDFPVLSISFTPLVQYHPDKKEIEKISDKLLNSFFDGFDSLPAILKHYTNPQGALGIISSSEFWAFKATQMGDDQEIAHAQSLIIRVCNSLRDSFGTECQEIIDRVVRIVCDVNNREKYFIVCFTASHRSKKHWEDYGARGCGVSLGVSSTYLGLQDSVQIRKVVYDEKAQEELIVDVVSEFCLLYEELKSKSKNWDENFSLACFTSLIDSHLTEFLYTFKRESFKEENEHRLLVKNELYQQYAVKETPWDKKRQYIPLKLSQTDSKINKLPLVAAYFGENCKESDKIKIVKMLYKNGYKHLEIGFLEKSLISNYRI